MRTVNGYRLSLTSLLMLLYCAICLAQQPIERNEVANASSLKHFETALSSLASEYKVAFVCEGEPFVRNLSDGDLQKLADKLDKEADPDARVRLIAEAYDYNAEKTGRTAFALTKRYSNADDMPALSLPETTERLRRMTMACSYYQSSPLKRPFRTLINSLTEEQKSALALKEGVPISQLQPDQQENLRMMMNYIVFSGLGSFRETADFLAGCLRKGAFFGDKRWNLGVKRGNTKGIGQYKYPVVVSIASTALHKDSELNLGYDPIHEADFRPDPISLPVPYRSAKHSLR